MMKNDEAPVLVLGAYGLAGRAIVTRLLAKTPYPVIAAGRNEARLRTLVNERVTACALDVNDHSALARVCGRASFVINAVGPYARNGAAVARVAMQCGKPYLDCANEQRHYHNLLKLRELARNHSLPLITCAGVFPGLSTLLAANMLERFSGVTAVDCCCVQFRNVSSESGLASTMGAILEAVEHPVSIRNGRLAPTLLGRSMKSFDLPEPFGPRSLLEVPLLDVFAVHHRFSLTEYHTWFYVGDMPAWLLGVVRFLQPQRRPWAYHMIEKIMRRMNAHETKKAIAAGMGPECLILVAATTGDGVRETSVLFQNGALATACVPVYIADACVRGSLGGTGLLTPLDLLSTDRLPEIVDGAAVSVNW